MNLLIVDDHPTNLKLLRAQLEAEGHTVCEAADGLDALALLERQPVDAVISDILMPRMDGFRLCREIRKSDRHRDLPVIFHTSTYTSPGDEKLALDVGASRYLAKPASTETLLAALREAVTRPRAASQAEPMPEAAVLKEYSEQLVRKLEEKNAELHQRTVELEGEVAERKQAEAMLACQTEVLELIAAGAPLPRTLDTMLRRMEAHTPGTCCSVLLLDVDGVHVRHGAAPSLPEAFNRAVDGQPIGPVAGSCGTAAFRREPVIVEDIATDPLWKDYCELALSHGLRACWSTPIFDGQRRVLGTFAIYYRQPGPPAAQHRQCVDMATHLAATAIARHRDDAAVRDSEARFRATFEQAAVGIAHVSPEGRWLRVNQRLCDLVGYSREELLLKTFQDITHPDDLAADLGQVRQMLAGEIKNYSLEKRYVRKDGSLVWINLTVALVRGETGQPDYFIAVVEDITAKQRMKENLRRAKEAAEKQAAELDRAFEVLPVGMFLVDRQGAIYKANKAVNDTWEGKMEAGSVLDYAAYKGWWPGSDRQLEPHEWPCAQSLRENVLSDEEIEIETFTGKRKTIRAISAPVVDANGHHWGAVAINWDITERKRAEQKLRESREQLRALLARLHLAREEEGTRISREIHDVLGHLLTGLKLELSGLERRVAAVEAEQVRAALAEKLRSATGLTAATVDAVKRIALELRPTVLDHLGLCAAIDCEAREFQQRSGIPCELALPEAAPVLEPPRAATLFRIFQESLTNIARHAGATRVRVRLAPEGGRVVLEVADNGRGITDAETARPGSLGLLGMRERALMAGGTLRLHGRQGRGTTVTVTLPVALESGSVSAST